MERSGVSGSHGKRSIRLWSHATPTKLRHYSDRSTSLQQLKAEANQCQTPQQFRELLELLRAFIPYRKLAAVWGYKAETTLRYVFNHGFSAVFVRWYLSTGALWTSPVFRQWRQKKRAVMVYDVVQRFKADFDPQLIKQYQQAGVYYAICGGSARSNYFVYFAAAMSSSKSGSANLKKFDLILPSLVKASQRAYPKTLLTKREATILERRAMGEIIKQIAMAEGISERTVREHLQQIKMKLCTDDLVNAVVIAVKSGMLFTSWKKSA